MKKIVLGLIGLLIVAGAAAWLLLPGPSEDGEFHKDHTRVFNAFQQETSDLVGGGGTSSVPPDSECKQVEDTKWRCYRRWAPVGHPEAAEILEADVEVYPERIVVGEVSRTPDP